MFRINYQLKKAEQIEPWGKELHWFGLTDSLLWIDAGNAVIYEYSDSAFNEWNIKYNDYQLARFLEDFSEIFPYVAEPIPKILYDSIECFGKQIKTWEILYTEKSDSEFFDDFLPNFYEPLCNWFFRRTFNSMHLVDGPFIGCFRSDDNVKIFWESDCNETLKDGSTLWKYPKGVYEMKYSEFVSEVFRFFNSFEHDMDNQVNNVLKNGIKDVFVDKDQLKKENTMRKESFMQKVNSLNSNSEQKTCWSEVLSLYNKMISEIDNDRL